MADKKNKQKSKSSNRPKPLAHTPGLTRTRRRYGCGGHIAKKAS